MLEIPGDMNEKIVDGDKLSIINHFILAGISEIIPAKIKWFTVMNCIATSNMAAWQLGTKGWMEPK